MAVGDPWHRNSMPKVLAQLCCGAALILATFSITHSSLQASQTHASLLSLLPANSEAHSRQLRFPALYERQLDEGEDYFSAIQAPDKPYEW
jgi:hypothetical protein